MTSDKLVAVLAERVMGWTPHPGRYSMKDRRWIPAWRFQPLKNTEDAIRLLDASDPEEYTVSARRGGAVTVRVLIRGIAGEASDASKARAITHAVARAIGLEPGDRKESKAGSERR